MTVSALTNRFPLPGREQKNGTTLELASVGDFVQHVNTTCKRKGWLPSNAQATLENRERQSLRRSRSVTQSRCRAHTHEYTYVCATLIFFRVLEGSRRLPCRRTDKGYSTTILWVTLDFGLWPTSVGLRALLVKGSNRVII